MRSINQIINESSNEKLSFEFVERLSELSIKYPNEFVWGVKRGSGIETAKKLAKEYDADETTLYFDFPDDKIRYEKNTIGFCVSNKESIQTDLDFMLKVGRFKNGQKSRKGVEIWWNIFCYKTISII